LSLIINLRLAGVVLERELPVHHCRQRPEQIALE
jgi:hypothetical protein